MSKSPHYFPSRTFNILVLLSLFLWCYTFRFFLGGQSALEGDAYPYLGHIRFYVENILKGVYPLWIPFNENGNVNEFFLRRIGEFNPFYFLIAFLNKIGFTFALAHRLFLGLYFLLGVVGFYLLAFRIYRDRTAALTAALLLLFSSWGGKVFESFIVLELIPAVWFAYFLTAFLQTPRHLFLLGAVFCLMIINITYIPFYFYTIFFIFIVIFAVVYFSRMRNLTAPATIFITKNKAFSLLCCALFLLSLIPGILWYQAAREGESLSLSRHVGSQTANTATVGIEKINEGGILPYHIFDRQFVNLDKLQLDDFYLPGFAFLMFASGIWFKLNRRFILLFAFGMTLFLIGLANAVGLHAFLYKHIPFFKYFRNLQFFLWLAVLPASILFVTGQVQSLIQDRPRHPWFLGWIVTIHVGAVLFSWTMGTNGLATYLVIIFSLVWMLLTALDGKNKQVGLWLLWAAIILQPFEALGHWAEHYPPVSASRYSYENKCSLNLPTLQEKERLLSSTQPASPPVPAQPYFAIRWYYDALTQTPYETLYKYTSIHFLVYDSVRLAENDNFDLKTITKTISDFKNPAFIHTDEPPNINRNGTSQARIVTADDPDFRILRSDVNSLAIQTSFTQDQFLVWTDNYHSRWRAHIDGKETPVYRTNILARGILVPAGEHVIRWQFGETWRYILGYFFITLYAGILGSILWLAYRLKTSA